MALLMREYRESTMALIDKCGRTAHVGSTKRQ